MDILNNCVKDFSDENFKAIKKSLDLFWKLVKEIRKELGVNSKYLDEYLEVIFETVKRTELNTIAEICDNISRDILSDCNIAICKIPIINHQNDKSEFYDIVEKYVKDHPINYIPDAKTQFYAAEIIMKNIDILCQKVKEKVTQNILVEIDYDKANLLYDKMCNIINNEKMAKFSQLLYDTFMFTPIFNLTISQFLCQSAEMLLFIELFERKYLYQLI